MKVAFRSFYTHLSVDICLSLHKAGLTLQENEKINTIMSSDKADKFKVIFLFRRSYLVRTMDCGTWKISSNSFGSKVLFGQNRLDQRTVFSLTLDRSGGLPSCVTTPRGWVREESIVVSRAVSQRRMQTKFQTRRRNTETRKVFTNSHPVEEKNFRVEVS
jgi:hypothetical protein